MQVKMVIVAEKHDFTENKEAKTKKKWRKDEAKKDHSKPKKRALQKQKTAGDKQG